MNAHFPPAPWQSSPAFIDFLDHLPPTPGTARRRAQQAKLAEAMREAARIERSSQREVDRAMSEAMRATQPKQSWHQGRRVKHVVQGRIHLIGDDDEKSRTGYATMNRFILGE